MSFSLWFTMQLVLLFWWLEMRASPILFLPELRFFQSIPYVVRISSRTSHLFSCLKRKRNLRKVICDYPESCKWIPWFSKWDLLTPLSLYTLVCLLNWHKNTFLTNESSATQTNSIPYGKALLMTHMGIAGHAELISFQTWEMSHLLKQFGWIYFDEITFGKMSFRQIVPSAKCLFGKKSVR